MGLGGCVIGSCGKEARVGAILKIYDRFGNGKFQSSELKSILSSEEISVTNMNKWKHRNIVEHAGAVVVRGRSTRLWKLTWYAVSLCKEIERNAT